MENILILDSTLREGQQATNVRFSKDQAVKIGKELDALGVDFIELSPIVSTSMFETAKELYDSSLKANLILHGRAMKSDIDLLMKLDPQWIAIFLSTSDIHLEHKLHASREDALNRAIQSIDYAKSHGIKLRFTCEDASRTEAEYLAHMVKTVHERGADRISITDTVGIMTPSSMFSIVSEVHRQVPKVNLDVHCHNDLGLALANSLAGIEGGANCIHACINGAGERAGIPKLAEVAMSLRVLYGQRTDLDVTRLHHLSKLFSNYTGLNCDPFSPIVGESVFRHKGGTHLGAVIKSDGKAYEAFSPETVGQRRRFVVGEYSGRNVVRYLSSELKLGLNEAQIEKAVARLKEKKGDLFEFEL